MVDAGDGGVFVVAHPYAILKVDAAGQLQWARRLDVGTYRETWLRLTTAAADGAGGLYVGGTYGEDYFDATTSADAWILRVSAEGEVVWSKRVGAADEGNMVRAMLAFEGGVVVAGSTWHQARAAWTPFVYRLGGDGALHFAETLSVDDCEGGADRGGHLLDGLVTRDGALLFAYHGVHQGYVSGLVRLHPDGAFAWSSEFGAGAANHLGPVITGLTELAFGGYVATGVYSGAQTASDWWLSGLDALGRPTWSTRVGAIDVPETTGRDEDGYPSLVPTNDGGLLLVGYGEAHAYPEDAMVAMKVFAKDGHVTFAPGSEVASAALVLEPRASCIAVHDAGLDAADHEVALVPLAVTVVTPDVPSRVLAP